MYMMLFEVNIEVLDVLQSSDMYESLSFMWIAHSVGVISWMI